VRQSTPVSTSLHFRCRYGDVIYECIDVNMTIVDCDLLVIGSGAAGMSAAITARLLGLNVILAEKEPLIGGTTALSGGWCWVPMSTVASASGVRDTKEAALTYLLREAGNRADVARIEAYLDEAPRMVAFFEEKTAVKFLASPDFPDYHSDAPGASRGRSIVASPFDARLLGDFRGKLRPPLVQTTFLGLNVGSGSELTHFFNATRSWRSGLYVLRRIVRHFVEVVRYGRGVSLANGNALAARLLKSAVDSGVELRVGMRATALRQDNGWVVGALLESNDGKFEVRARHGVVLACGGFSHDDTMQRRLFPHVRAGGRHASPAATGATGDGLRLGEEAGGAIDDALPNAAAWMPVSQIPRKDGALVFPHVIDRAKPGVIAVIAPGKRFVNEALSYHDFVQALLAATSGSRPQAFLICDHRTLRRFGLGYARPFPVPITSHLASGYLHRGRTIGELAARCGLDPPSLEETVAAFNRDAEACTDTQFSKGSTAYNRFQGDQSGSGDPCLAPLLHAPFYAVAVEPGDIGTFAGLKVNEAGQVLDRQGQAIRGLYAAGNDSVSVMAGSYPGAGINLGPAMTFGYVIGRHAANLSPDGRCVPARSGC